MSGLAAGRPLVEMDLGTGTAGPGVPHGPEVVLLSQAKDPAGWNSDLSVPDPVRIVIIPVDGDPELFRLQPVDSGHQLPGQRDGFRLEVVAEGKVPQHFEEGVVPGGFAHVLKVVVLSAGPNAFLGGGGPKVVPPLPSQKNVLELIHAGVGEQQGGVVGGDQRGALDDAMPSLMKIFQELPAGVVSSHGFGFLCAELSSGREMAEGCLNPPIQRVDGIAF